MESNELKINQKVCFDAKETKRYHWLTPYGFIFRYVFTDNQDNQYIWTTQKKIDDQISTVFGRVKNIQKYEGQNQYVLTYCHVL